MIMETLSCGYPVAPSVLGAPLSPPATPTGTENHNNNNNNNNNYAPQIFAPTHYVQPTYGTPFCPPSSKYGEDANNNNNIYNDTFASNLNNLREESTSLQSDLSNLSIEEESEDLRLSDLSPVSECSSSSSSSTSDFRAMSVSQSPPPSPPADAPRPKTKKNSRSKAKSSTQSQDGGEEEQKSRKDSFVYDVRLPHEQFLFFVPDLDLVKSHLMFAVREEVDVLKDKIVELMDRIKHLECENTILRQYASPEVLQQLQSQMTHQLQQTPHHSSTS